MMIKFFLAWFIYFKNGIPGPEGIGKSSGRGKETTGSVRQSTEGRRKKERKGIIFYACIILPLADSEVLDTGGYFFYIGICTVYRERFENKPVYIYIYI